MAVWGCCAYKTSQCWPNTFAVIHGSIHGNNIWLTVDYDFWSLGGDLSRLKIIVELLHQWPKSLFAVNHQYYISYKLCHVLTHKFAENDHQSFISLLSLRAVFSNLAMWRHHAWSIRYANVRNCYWDVIFVDRSCARQLVKSLWQLMNSNCEYALNLDAIFRWQSYIDLTDMRKCNQNIQNSVKCIIMLFPCII